MHEFPANEGRPSPGHGSHKGTDARWGQRFQFGPWLFSIDRAQALIAERPREMDSVDVVVWAEFYGLDALDSGDRSSVSLFAPTKFNPEYAITTNLDSPVIFAVLQNKDGQLFPLLIDGVHRLYRAYREGVPNLPAYVLDVDESLVIREDVILRGGGAWPRDPSGLMLDATEQDGGDE